MSHDRPLLGIALMLGFCVIAPLADALAKIAGETVAIGPAVLLRFAVQVMLLSPFILFSLGRLRLTQRAALVCLLRSFFHILAIGFMFTALRHMPLADTVAIVFVLPFLNLGLGWLFLGEQIGPARFGASCAGFLGVLLVIQPSFAEVGWLALLPLGAALSFSIFMVITRHAAATIDPIAMQYVSGAMAVALLMSLIFLGTQLSLPDLGWHPINRREWIVLLALAALSTAGHLLMTWSLKYAPSATLAPMQYVEIPVAAAIGYVVFAEWPGATASFGIALTMLSGLFIICHEELGRRRAKAALRPAALPPAAAMQPAAE